MVINNKQDIIIVIMRQTWELGNHITFTTFTPPSNSCMPNEMGSFDTIFPILQFI
jgi:hypothetical protein